MKIAISSCRIDSFSVPGPSVLPGVVTMPLPRLSGGATSPLFRLLATLRGPPNPKKSVKSTPSRNAKSTPKAFASFRLVWRMVASTSTWVGRVSIWSSSASISETCSG